MYTEIKKKMKEYLNIENPCERKTDVEVVKLRRYQSK